MNTKLVRSLTLLFSACFFLFSSCGKDDDQTPPKPTILIEELGSGHDAPDDHAVQAGSDLHIEAQITAEGLIARIDVEIHQEEGGSFEIEQSYTEGKYIDVKNTEFHEHIDIPADAPAGEYHFHLTVTDRLGQTATAEADLDIH